MRGRVIAVRGDAGAGLRYADLFHTGFGVEMEASRTWTHGTTETGLWASFAFDRFEGDGYTDDVGDRISPSRLDRFLGMAGGRLTFHVPEPVFEGNMILLDFRAGAGLARYGDVHAAFRVGGTTVNAELFENTLSPALQMNIAIGVASPTFSIGLGAGIRMLRYPEKGDDVTSAIDPDYWTDFSAELGLTCRF